MFYSIFITHYRLIIKEFSIFLIAFFCVFHIKAQKTASSMNLNGNIRVMYTYSHLAEDIIVKDNILVSYQKKGKPIKHIDYIFDRKGFLLVENKYNDEDILDISSIYDYDEHGRIIEETLAEGGKYQLGRQEYEYNKNGKQSKLTVYDNKDSLKNRIFYNYDSLGNLSSEKAYNKIGGIIKEIYYQYDERGNQIFVDNRKTGIYSNKPYQEIMEFNNGNKLIYKSYTREDTLIWVYIAQYNKNDSLIYEEVKNGHGEITSYSSLEYKKDKRISMKQYLKNRRVPITETYYKYDKQGKLITEEVYNANKKELTKTRTYFYDEKQNWIYCIEHSKEGDYSIVYYRKINYF